jgi:tricorn protease
MHRILLVMALVSLATPLHADEARLLRFPTIHGDNVVFTHAGDLYTVSAKGGIARRLTSHEGQEMFARFSPDGRHIAFTGQYDGNTEIYVIPAEGGEPRRLTYTATLERDDVSDRMGPNNICMGWTPDGKHVVFRSRMHSHNDFIGHLYKVPVEGGLAEELPLPRGGFCSFSPDGKKLAYNRVFREFRTWKRYRGGMADDVWVYDFDTKKTTQMTNTPAQEIIPMWAGDRIYFLSDREKSGRMNLYSIPAAGGEAVKHTDFQELDVKFPSLGDKAIVFEQAGYLWKLDLAKKKAERIKVRILEDRAGARGKLLNVAGKVTNFEISPDGSRALFGARGDVFTVPAKKGPTRNLTNTPGVHERNSKWSPDGKSIAFISDASGEDEVWVTPADGSGKPTQLTKGGDTYKFEIQWSPDSSKILWTDKKLRVMYVEVGTRRTVQVAKAPVWEVRDAVWSPDSKWIAWSQEELKGGSDVHLFSVAGGKSQRVTEGWYPASEPCFSGDGKYLLFVSARDFNPIYSQTEWNHAYRDMSRIYAALLAKDTPSPWAVKDESEKTAPPAPPKDAPKGKDDKPKGVEVKVDLDGLSERILQLPVKPSNYRNLQSVGSTVYYVSPAGLAMYDLAAKKETALGKVGGYEISADGKKMIVSEGGKYAIIDLPKGPVTISDPLNLSGMEMQLDRKAEWKQMFHECWRQMRDFFYDENMHGVDWKGMRDKYEPLVEHVGHRADLTYIIGEMISELNAGHAYVGGGDMPKAARIPQGLLGAKLRQDANGNVQVVKVLRGNRWDPALRSPLNAIGSEVKDGEWIVAVDGKATKDMANILESLVNKVGKQVKLTIKPTLEAKESRTILVEPIADESALFYHDWVEGNLKKVTDATGGKVGYLHVPDMLATGLNQFAKYFYPQVKKKALIIDMRGNGGGNVSPMLIERLRREIAMITIARNSVPRTDPAAMVWGPMVCLMNEFSASDGDLFPYRFRHHKLGKLIGKRSWGGVVGIRGSLPLLDGGTLNRPEFSRYDVEGKEWIIEGKGVTPDIIVDNDPAKEYAGEDQQLQRAIDEVMKELKAGGEKDLPKPPPTPKR